LWRECRASGERGLWGNASRRGKLKEYHPGANPLWKSLTGWEHGGLVVSMRTRKGSREDTLRQATRVAKIAESKTAGPEDDVHDSLTETTWR